MPADEQAASAGLLPRCPGRMKCIQAATIIIVLVMVIYGRTATFSFVGFDDPQLVFENPLVSGGLSLAGLRWAWCDAWRQSVYLICPLALTTHMIDVSLFGLWPGGHHLVNIAWHAAVAVMLLIWMARMTGAIWRPALVAALFAAHPLGADVVAWVAQRSTLLTTFFSLAAMTAYHAYCRQETAGQMTQKWFLFSFILFLLAVFAKPSAVVLPLALFPLDWLCRNKSDGTSMWPAGRKDFIEKVPFFIVSAAIIVMTLIVSRSSGAAVSGAAVPFSARFANALVAAGLALVKTIFPSGLCVYYPFPDTIPWWQPVGALALLTAVTIVVVARRARAPMACFGWFWFLITLLPGLGLVQAGPWPARADHLMYLPLTGLLIALVWSIPVEKLKTRGKYWAAFISVIGVLVYGAIAFWQAGFYRDSQTLFGRALAVTDNNFLAHTGLGNALLVQGRLSQAERQFRQALAIRPNAAGAHVNLGLVLARTGREDAAGDHYRKALALDPRFVEAHVNLANLLSRQGDCGRSVAHYLAALAIRPEAADINYNLGRTLIRCGNIDDARPYLSKALMLRPDDKRYQSAWEHAF